MNKQVILDELQEILTHYYQDEPRLERIIKCLKAEISYDEQMDKLKKDKK